MRISNDEAEQRAIALAEAYLAQQDHRGWSWRCLGANPNRFVPDNKHRKTHTKWIVVVDLRPPGSTFDDGNVFDGPATVDVDILSGDVAFR